MKTIVMVVMATGFALAGCVQLEVVKIDGGEGVIEGIPYSLPRKTFVLKVEYQLKECPGANGATALNIDRSIDYHAGIEPDPEEHYFIPYSSMGNWLKATDLKLDSHDNQTLKGIGLTIEDRTAAVVSSVVGTAISLAAPGAAARQAAAPAPPPGLPAPAPAPPTAKKSPCTAEALKALRRMHKLRLEARDAAATPPTGNRTADEINIEMARVADILRRKYSVRWSPTRWELDPQVVVPDVSAWLVEPHDGDTEALVAQLPTSMKFVTDQSISDGEKAPRRSDGLLVRWPVNGSVLVCKGSCPQEGQDANAILEAHEEVIPQLGPYISLPLKNRIFQSNTISLTITDAGVIQTIGYKTNAVAEAGAASIQANVDAIRQAQARREQAKAASSSVTQQNTAISECLAAQKAVRDAGGTPVGSCQ